MHAVSLYFHLIWAVIRSQMQFRGQFLFSVAGNFAAVFLEFAAIALLFERFDSVRGWSLGEVAFLYGLVEISFGLMDLVFSGFDPGFFGRQVRRGALDQLLLRPVNLTVQILGSDFALRRLAKTAVGIGIFRFALSQTDITWTAAKLAYLPVVILGMILFFGAFFIMGSVLTFWTVESTEIVNVLTYGGSHLSSFPMHIYQRWLRRLFTFVIPAAFINYYPSLYFLDRTDPFGLPGWTTWLAPAVGAGFFLLSLLLWRVGLRHYTSTGS